MSHIKLKSLLRENIDSEYLNTVHRGDIDTAQKMVDKAAREASYSVGPVTHKTMSKFNKFDINKSSSGAVWGPAIYASMEGGSWNPLSLSKGKTLSGYVMNNVLDMTHPTLEDFKRLSQLIGRSVDALPLTTLELRFGSVAAGLLKAGYSATIHYGPGATGKHIAIFLPNYFKSSDPVTYDDKKNVIPISKRFDSSNDDFRF